MFLYLLNEKEGKSFMELAVQAMSLNEEMKDNEKAGYDTYLVELNLLDYKTVGIPFNDATASFKLSTIQVKRSVIIELCGILYSGKSLDSKKTNWIYKVSDKFKIDRAETDRLIRWSKDFSDFVEIGLMYINAKN